MTYKIKHYIFTNQQQNQVKLCDIITSYIMVNVGGKEKKKTIKFNTDRIWTHLISRISGD